MKDLSIFFKHDDVARIIEHVKSVLEASVDYCYPNHPEVEFERARRGKDISSFERQEKESGFNFLHNPNNGRMQSGHIIIDGIGLFKQIIHER